MEALGVLVVVAVLGFVGYRVYLSRKDNNTTNTGGGAPGKTPGNPGGGNQNLK